MSANPTRVDWEAPPSAADPAFPLQEGNRVLESLARQEALRALLAFSDLHERIRSRSAEGTASASDLDLFQTERFVLDEVLQLICDRALAITQADAILVALSEGSEFLQDCLDSGRILRCDDCNVDARVDLDFSRQIGARATVLVPLHGQCSRMGVLQAFSNVPYAFSDDDVRCLDLLAELVLSALKPEDQDRRVNWLADVVDEVLCPKPVGSAQVVTGALENEIPPLAAEPQVLTEGTSLPVTLSVLHEAGAGTDDFVSPDLATEAREAPSEESPAPAFLASSATSRTPNPGLMVVLVLVAVAALFSAGVWFGMRNRATT